MAEPSLGGWDISARTYALSYGPLAHRLDRDLFTHFDDLIKGAVVADLGCGPGIVARKFIDHGAEKVFAVDVSEKMLKQVDGHPSIVTMQATMEMQPLDRLRSENVDAKDGFDLVLFKRSLYMQRSSALEILKNAYFHLRPGGGIGIVHPEKKLRIYAFGSPPRLHLHTFYNLFNRTLSRIGVLLGVESYTLHTREELFTLAGEVAGPEHVETVATRQQAFNLLAIRKPLEKS